MATGVAIPNHMTTIARAISGMIMRAGSLVALHALGRLAEDGLERDAGKGKVHAGEANGHEHDHPDGTGLDAGHEGEELGDEQGERREGGEREQGDDGERRR